MLYRSPRDCSWVNRAVACLSTGADSPVRADSCTCRLTDSTNRPSAGTIFPASSNTRSPRTTAAIEHSCTWPSRRTRTVGTANFFRAAMARSALHSWRNPRTALKITMARIAIASRKSPTMTEITAATISMTTKGALSCSQSTRQGDLPAAVTNSLGPSLSNRCWAVSAVRPRSK